MKIQTNNLTNLVLKLEFKFSDGRVQVESRPGPSITIGRGSSADIVIHDNELSRKHLRIELINGGAVSLTDLGSTNGTFIGEEQLPPQTPTEFNTFFIPIKLGKKISLFLSLE